GQMSRVLCPVLTPVTHPLLAAKAAPGQISVQQINVARATAGLLPARKMALCGTPIQHSPSPAMHNAAFSALGLPHVYGLFETAEASSLTDLFAAPEFGGASITIPLKQSVIPLLDQLTPAARRIGAVNTVIPVGGKLLGDNTDYLGIVGCLRRSQVTAFPKATALVVGAGGTSRAALYALYALGIGSVIVYNRTAQRADELVVEFSELFTSLVAVSDLAALESPDYIVGTIPASDLVYPDSLFAKVGVALDMAYKPRWTPLLESAQRHGWSVVPGVDVLIEQGIHQLEKWTHLTAPTKIMADAVYTKYNADN
ncbi:hypothetical protein GGI09_009194, partial [Coemansia sp. S100]